MKREIESLLIKAQNIVLNTNCIKEKLDKTQNIKCIISGDKEETVNKIRECSNQAQKKYKNEHDWVGKVIYLELCKKLKCHNTDKWYMHQTESVIENCCVVVRKRYTVK